MGQNQVSFIRKVLFRSIYNVKLYIYRRKGGVGWGVMEALRCLQFPSV